MLVEEQISARQARGQSAILKVLAEPESAAYGDYEVQAHSGRKYRVAMRGPGLFGPIPSVKSQSPNGSETKQSGVPGPGPAPAARAGESLASRKAVDAARSFIQAGLELIASLSPADSSSPNPATRLPPVHAVQQALAGCIRRNAQTQRAEFAIPLPESVTGEQIARAAGSLLEKIVSALGP